MKDWVSEHAEGAVLHVLGQPQTSRSEIVGLHGDSEQVRLKVRIAAPPVEGEANEELLRFLKKSLKSHGVIRVSLIRGAQSKQKDLLCEGVTAAVLRAALEKLWAK